MKKGHAPEQYVTVGSGFASQLGYESVVGALGIIDNVMNAMCGVTILAGQSEFIGKQVDIHIQDCIVDVPQSKEDSYHVIINMRDGRVYYSADKDLALFTNSCLTFTQKREVFNIKDMSTIWDMIENDSTIQKFTETNRLDWIMVCLDDERSQEAKSFRDTFEAKQAENAAQQEAFDQVNEAFKKAKQARMDEIKADKRGLPIYVKPTIGEPKSSIIVNPEDTIPEKLSVDSENPKPLKSLVEELRKQVFSQQQDEVLKKADEAIKNADEVFKRLHEGEQLYSQDMKEAMGKTEEYEPSKEEKDGHYDPTDM